MTALLIWTAVWPTISVQAEDRETLKVAQYVRTEATKQNDGSYSGKWIADVPMTEVLKSAEPDMKKGAKGFFGNIPYPWKDSAKSGIAEIVYQVKFPQGCVIGNVATENGYTFLGTIQAEKTNDSVTFRIPLTDQNWAGIYDAYQEDKKDTQKKLKLTVEYTTGESKNAKIVGDGNFSFYMWFKTYLYSSDKSTTPVTGGKSQATKLPDPPKSTDVKLAGDMLINGNTQADKVYVANKTDAFTVTGALNVKPIKDELAKLKKLYDPQKYADIKVTGAVTTFKATMTLPEGLEMADDWKAELTGANGKFKITKKDFKNQVVTVEMSTTGNLNSFESVCNTVDGADDLLKVNVTGVKFKDSAEADKEYKIVGTLIGTFSAKATLNGNTVPFSYTWGSKQSEEGKDSTAKNTDEISLTVKYLSPAVPQPTPIPTETKPEPYNPYTSSELKEEPASKLGKVAKTGELVGAGNSWCVLLAVAAACLLQHKRQN
ncbi:hypothetical protein PYS61_02315 [Amygdalobacter indicium]|uniref:Htaa protein n=1 Tax=Amygdalobacter indicium TaxID=3029272 RepID=A0ABY8C5P7_9FIRM|nr:hypothetical protein [Amygdalobacter indicium]WEG36026.1 hypothetical protein PYS61_02315 [Amygdalobacter indicium]